MRLAPNDLIYYSPMGVRVRRQASPGFTRSLNFCEIRNFSFFDETHKIRCRSMRSTPNDLIYSSPMGVRVGRQASPVFSTTAVANNRVCGLCCLFIIKTASKFTSLHQKITSFHNKSHHSIKNSRPSANNRWGHLESNALIGIEFCEFRQKLKNYEFRRNSSFWGCFYNR